MGTGGRGILLLVFFACSFHAALGNEEEFGIGTLSVSADKYMYRVEQKMVACFMTFTTLFNGSTGLLARHYLKSVHPYQLNSPLSRQPRLGRN